MLEIDVQLRRGSFALDCAFSTDEAGVTVVFGRSGCGKTSLVDAIAGLLRPDRGRIRVNDAVLFNSAEGIDLPARRRRIGYVFQDARLFPHYSVRGNLLFGRRLVGEDQRWGSLDHVVDLLGLEALLHRRPAGLSGGERQRVAIGRALLASPRLLLMDEPLASLDAPRKAEILPYIERLRDEVKLPIVYVSHAIEEVARLATTMVVLDQGRVAAVGPPTEVLSRLDLGGLTGGRGGGAVLDCRVAALEPAWSTAILDFAGGRLIVPDVGLAVAAPVRIRIPARDVAIALVRPVGVSMNNVLPARIVEIGPVAGAAVDIRLDVGVPLLARITARSVADLALHPGQAVFALIKSVAIDRPGAPQGAGRETDTLDG